MKRAGLCAGPTVPCWPPWTRKSPCPKKLVFTHKDGTMGVIQAHFVPLADEKGQIRLVAEQFEEVSLLDQEA